jgi:hypothetical protein
VFEAVARSGDDFAQLFTLLRKIRSGAGDFRI